MKTLLLLLLFLLTSAYDNPDLEGVVSQQATETPSQETIEGGKLNREGKRERMRRGCERDRVLVEVREKGV